MTLKTKREQSILVKEYIKLEHKEERLFAVKEIKPGLMDKVRKKIPEKAMNSLEKAFEKGFFFLFDRGGAIIEKTGSIEKARANSEKYHQSLELMIHKDTLKAIDNAANSKINFTKGTSTIEGAAFGVFGIGLPDIPIFLAMLLKTSYEIAANYGFDYRDDEERPYTLALLKVAFSEGEERARFNKECDELGRQIDDDELVDCDVDEDDLKEISEVLATDMLVGKFIQGLTFVGVVGGAINYRLVNKIAKVAKVKYKKRFLYKLINQDSNLP